MFESVSPFCGVVAYRVKGVKFWIEKPYSWECIWKGVQKYSTNSPVIKQKGESQNGDNKKAKPAKYSNSMENEL